MTERITTIIDRIKLQDSIHSGRASNERLQEMGQQIIAQHPELANTVNGVLGSMAFSQSFFEVTMEHRFGVTAEKFDSRNSTKVVRIDTHRLTAMEENVSYPIEDLRQGRDCKNPVPKCSMYAGKPVEVEGNEVRAMFWQTYAAIVALTVVCVVILANWPN